MRSRKHEPLDVEARIRRELGNLDKATAERVLMQIVVHYVRHGDLRELLSAFEDSEFLRSQLRKAMATLQLIGEIEGELPDEDLESYDGTARAREVLASLRSEQAASGVDVESRNSVNFEYLEAKYGWPPT